MILLDTEVYGVSALPTVLSASLVLDIPAFKDHWLMLYCLDGLRSIYRYEGLRGLYKGSLLALVGVSNGSIQFAAYEEIKQRRTDLKRRRFDKVGRRWRVEDEKLVSIQGFREMCRD